MEKETASFLEAEETAERLVETLNKLKNEADSYKGASKELDVTRQELSRLIDSHIQVTEGTKEVIDNLKNIGWSEIQNTLSEIKTETKEQLDIQTTKIDKLRNLVTGALVISIVAMILGIANLATG